MREMTEAYLMEKYFQLLRDIYRGTANALRRNV
jgi:hypothetical protein